MRVDSRSGDAGLLPVLGLAFIGLRAIAAKLGRVVHAMGQVFVLQVLISGLGSWGSF